MFKEERIGAHRLILGDCLEVMPTLGKVDHCISDPPYEQAMHDLHTTAVFRRTDSGPARKHFTFSGIDELRPELITAISEQCDGWFLAFCTAEGVGAWRQAVIGSQMKFKTTCIWVKPDCAPKLNGQGPAVGYEPFITVWAGKGVAKWNAGGKRGVYTHNTNPSDRHGVHPTEKPWRLMAEILKDFTNPGQTILDPFMGSGTTIVACQKLGRAGIGIELDPEYFAIACKRVDEATRQPDLFIEQPKPVKQDAFDL